MHGRSGFDSQRRDHPISLMDSNFAALWSTETHSTSFERAKRLLLTHSLSKRLEAFLKIDFALSEWPYFNNAYVLGVCNNIGSTVFVDKNMPGFSKIGDKNNSIIVLQNAWIWLNSV